MKIKVNTKQLEDALKKLEVVRPNKSKELPILENVKLEALEDSIQLTSTDLSNYVIATITDVEVEQTGSILLTNPKEILKSFKFFKDYNTTIELINNEVKISNSNKNVKIESLDVVEFPQTPAIINIENQYTYNTKSLYHRIKKVDFAICNDPTRPILTGIHFNGSEMAALDGYKLAINKDYNLTVNKPFTISNSLINFLLKTIDKKKEDTITIQTTEHYSILEYDNIKIISRLLQGEFVEYNNFIPKEFNGKVEVNTNNFKNDIEFLNTYIKDTVKEFTKLSITDELLELKVNTMTGIYNTEDKIKNTNYNIEIGFNNSYMLDILKVIESKNIQLCFNGSVNPIIIEESENELYLLMPVRIGDRKAA